MYMRISAKESYVSAKKPHISAKKPQISAKQPYVSQSEEPRIRYQCRFVYTLHCVLQCVAVCCSVLQCVAVYCSVLQCAAVCPRAPYMLQMRVCIWICVVVVVDLWVWGCVCECMFWNTILSHLKAQGYTKCDHQELSRILQDQLDQDYRLDPKWV